MRLLLSLSDLTRSMVSLRSFLKRHDPCAQRLERGADAAGIAGGVILGHDPVVARPDGDARPVERQVRQFGKDRKRRRAAGHAQRDPLGQGILGCGQPCMKPTGDDGIVRAGNEFDIGHALS